MDESLEKQVRSLLERQDESAANKAAIDVLKALLLLYGSAWESDLKDMLAIIWSARQLSLEDMGELQAAMSDAEKILQEMGLIKIEEKYRGDLSKSEATLEKLYTTDHLLLLMKILGGDKELDRIRFQLQG